MRRVREKLGPAFLERLRRLVDGRGGASEVVYAAYPTIALVSLYAWMRGAKEPSLAKLGPLADVLGVSIDYLIRGSDADDTAPPPSHGDLSVGEDEIRAILVAIRERLPHPARIVGAGK